MQSRATYDLARCDVSFKNADLSGAYFRGCTFENVDFEGGNLDDVTDLVL